MTRAAFLIAVWSAGAVALAAAPQSTKAPAKAPAQSKTLTLLVTGDNRGEIAPCG